MQANYACQTKDHFVARRRFLGSVAGGAIAGMLGSVTQGFASQQMQQTDKRVIVFNLHGGLSQLESWDPKPGTTTGGPFRAIPTSVLESTSANSCHTPRRSCII